MMSTNDEEAPVKVSETKARGGVTGHNVRYVLTFGLMGVIAAFIALGIYYGLGDKPNPAPELGDHPSGVAGRSRRAMTFGGADLSRRPSTCR